jgi:hypothetical protein
MVEPCVNRSMVRYSEWFRYCIDRLTRAIPWDNCRSYSGIAPDAKTVRSIHLPVGLLVIISPRLFSSFVCFIIIVNATLTFSCFLLYINCHCDVFIPLSLVRVRFIMCLLSLRRVIITKIKTKSSRAWPTWYYDLPDALNFICYFAYKSVWHEYSANVTRNHKLVVTFISQQGKLI